MKPRNLTLSWSLSLLAAAVVSAPRALASDALSTPFSLNLTTASAQALLSGVTGFQSPSGTLQETLPDQQVSTPFPVSISGIHLSLDYSFQAPEPSGGVNEWAIQSKSIGARLVIDSIAATQSIVETVGGITFTVQINGTCSGVTLVLPPGDAQISAKVKLGLNGGSAALTLADFAASWTPGSWQVTSMSCQGPQGFGQLVGQGIKAQLESISPFLPDIETQIQAQMAKASSAPLSWTLQANDGSGISLTLSPKQLALGPAGEARLDGEARFSFSRLDHSSCAATLTGSAPPPPSAGTDSLVLPVAAIQGLIRCGYLNGSLGATWSSQDFPAFQALLGNWLASLFVWPDLQRFDSSSVFGFELFPTAEPELTGMSTDSSGELVFNLSAPLLIAVFAPEGNGFEHYVDLETSVSGPATVAIRNGVLLFRQKISKLGITPFWDSIYAGEHDPNEYIWTSQIAGDMKGFLASPGLSSALPSWQVPGAFNLSIGNAVSDGTNVTVSLVINSQK